MKTSFNKLWTYLNSRRITKKEFKEITGFDDGTMQRLEHNDDMLRIDVIDRICRCLGCTLSDIMDTE